MVKLDTTTHQAAPEASAGVTGWTLLKQHLLTPVLDFIFPPVCVGCGQVGAVLCSQCQTTVHPEVYQAGETEAQVAIQAFLALGTFGGMLQQAVHALKYDNQQALAEPLGNLLASAARQADWPRSLIIPVPLHATRLAERGYNQSGLLGAAIARQLGWPFAEHALARTRQTASQVGLDYQGRQANVRDAFEVIQPERIRGIDVVLVDDVHTTGATLRECARVLRQSGAQLIRAMVIGRARAADSSSPRHPGQSVLT